MDFISLQALVLPLLLMFAGLAVLIKGGDWTIDSAVFIARRFGLSPMVVGFTVLAIGTSLPELVVSVLAVFQGSAGIAMGNVIGSNIANILAVIGVSAIIGTIHVKISKGLIKDTAMMLISAGLLLAFMQYGAISRFAGVVMIVFLVVYVFLQYRMALSSEAEVEADDDYKAPDRPYVFLLLGLIGISVGAEFLVRGASESAAIIGIPEDVIALSVIALGTSLPELSTSIISARRGHSAMALGNVLGSNVFNILAILGVTAVLKPILSTDYAPQLLNFDIWVMLLVSFVFAALLLVYKKINKAIGIVFVAAYVLYNIYIYALYLTA